jgi:hypothetical protein
MDRPFIKAQHYYDQAQKMRQLAACEEDEASRSALLEIADGYDRLCNKFLQVGQQAVIRKA